MKRRRSSTDPTPRRSSRRGFLQRLAWLFPLLGGATVRSRVQARPTREKRSLSFFHTHTSNELSVTYKIDGEFVPRALEQVNEFLGDFRNGEAYPIDPQLLDLLHEVLAASGSTGVFHVISAYRSPETNDMLRQRSKDVAKNSMHVQGKAIDVRLTDLPTARLRDVALELKLGGVGYYRKSDFVHLDTGRVRRW